MKKGTERIAMMTARKNSATGFGIRRDVLRKASGTAKTVPTQVPTSAMHTVSSSRYPRPPVSAWKKKRQSGWTSPDSMAPTVPRLVWEKSGGWMVMVQTIKSKAPAHARSRLHQGARRRSSRTTWARKPLSPSITHTVTNSRHSITPTLLYSRQEIFSFSSNPMPPAPT